MKKSKKECPVVVRVRNWLEFRKLVESPDYQAWAFRGQRSAEWKLECSLARIFRMYRVNKNAQLRQEERLLRVFQRKAHLFLEHLPDPSDVFQWLALMQHFGAPTRLLDFTWSPYVAAFFALEQAHYEQNAAVWAISPKGLMDASLPDRDGLMAFVPRDFTISSRKQYEEKYLRDELAFVTQGEPFVMNKRLVSQAGTFVVSSLLDRPAEAILASYPEAENLLVKFELDTKRVREEAMRCLYRMNISNYTLFPGLEGLGKSLNYEAEWHWEFNPQTNRRHKWFADTTLSVGSYEGLYRGVFGRDG